MSDELIELAVAAALDIATGQTAKKRRGVRIVKLGIGLLFVAAIGAVIYLTLRYS